MGRRRRTGSAAAREGPSLRATSERTRRTAPAPAPDPENPSTWTPRPPSPARTTVVVLQLLPMAIVAVATLGAAWWLLTSSAGAPTGTLVSAVLVVPVAAALLWLGATGLRRWLAGGPPTRLYGFDALPVIFMAATAPGAFQDMAGILLALAFILPGLVTFLASSR